MRLALLCLLLLASATGAARAAGTCAHPNREATGVAAWSPGVGSAERKALLGALRTSVRAMSGLDVVFVVTHLKTDCHWAWAEAEPRSADGSQHYESIQALLERRNGKWRYVEGPPEWPVCEVDPDCSDRARYFRKLAARHPGLAPAIFPAVVESAD